MCLPAGENERISIVDRGYFMNKGLFGNDMTWQRKKNEVCMGEIIDKSRKIFTIIKDIRDK